MKSILDPTFRYTSSVNTDIGKTFARIRREQKAAALAAAETKINVHAFDRAGDRKVGEQMAARAKEAKA